MSGSGSARRDRWTRFVPAGYSGVLALLIAGPLLGPGYLLLRDAVSTPRSYPTDSALGLGDAAPRAVPQDALLATLSPIIDGGLIVKAILLVALWAAGYGAAVLTRELLRVSTAPQLVAVTVALWNPYVAERLLQGHWSLLTGYAALPWTALAAYRIRASTAARHSNKPGPPDRKARRRAEPGNLAAEPRTAPDRPAEELAQRTTASDVREADRDAERAVQTGAVGQRSVGVRNAFTAYRTRTEARRTGTARRLGAAGAWGALAGCFAAAGLTPTGALLAGCTAVVLVGWRNLLGALGLLLAASAPWLTATALSGAGSEPSDPAGIAAFAARAEPGLGTLGSLAGLGGIWNGDAVPDSRITLLALIGTLLLLAVVATGIRATASSRTAASSGVGIRATTSSGAEIGSTDSSRVGIRPTDSSNIRPADSSNIRATDSSSIRPADSGGVGKPPESGGIAAPTDHSVETSPGPDSAAASRRSTDAEVGSATAHSTHRETDTATDSVDYASLRVRRALLILAVAAVVLPALGATPWGMSVMEWLVAGVPGAGLLRDTQKYVALAMPAYALCAAAGCRALGVRFASTNAHSPAISLTATAFVALLALPLFDLAYGVGGELRPVHYPAGWQRVAEQIDGPGDIAVLPGGMFRKFPYSGKAPVLDPAPRMLPRDVLQTGELPVRGRTVAGEGARAREAETLLLHGGSARQLGDLGVGWVLVERTTPGPLGESKTTLAQLDPIYTDQDLALYRVPAVADHRSESQSNHRMIAYAAHILWAALLVGGLLLAALLRPRPTA